MKFTLALIATFASAITVQLEPDTNAAAMQEMFDTFYDNLTDMEKTNINDWNTL